MGGDGLDAVDEAELVVVEEAAAEEEGLKLTRSFAHASRAFTHAQWRAVLPDSLPVFTSDGGKSGRERMYARMSIYWV